MHQPFTKGPAAYDHSPVPVLECPCQNLTGRCRVTVDQHYQVSPLKIIRSGCFHRIAGLILPFGIYNQFSVTQELVGNIVGCLKDAPSVIGEVEYKMFHPLRLQLFHSLPEFPGRSDPKAAQTDVSDITGDHVSSIDAGDGYLIPDNPELHQPLHTTTKNLHVGNRSLGSAKTFDDILVVHLHAGNKRIIHIDDLVTRHDAYFL